MKRMSPMSAEQFVITLSSCVLFPFAAGPMLTEVLGLNGKQFSDVMEQRRRELPALLKKVLQR